MLLFVNGLYFCNSVFLCAGPSVGFVKLSKRAALVPGRPTFSTGVAATMLCFLLRGGGVNAKQSLRCFSGSSGYRAGRQRVQLLRFGRSLFRTRTGPDGLRSSALLDAGGFIVVVQ